MSDWKTPLGVYERAIAEVTKLREEFKAEIQAFRELHASNAKLKTELQSTQAELQSLKAKFQASQIEIEATKVKLQKTKAELQATNERLEILATESQKTAEIAVLEAKNAQNIANTAWSKIETVKTEIENGSIIAQKAAMLRGKDNQNWMRFYKIDSVYNHCFQVWKSDDETWHRISGVGVDYRKLEQLLEAWNWQEADEETFEKILEVASRKKEGNLSEKDLNKFLYEELYTIDQLWLKYSKGHFGFSVQKRIYENLGGTQKYDEKIWQDFGQRVGWRVNNQWLWYRYLNFSIKAPPGHLPARLWDDWRGGGVGSFYSLMPRLINCNI